MIETYGLLVFVAVACALAWFFWRHVLRPFVDATEARRILPAYERETQYPKGDNDV